MPLTTDPTYPNLSSDDHRDVPSTSLLPKTETPDTAAADLMKRVTQGAHDTIDRVAKTAAPQVQRLGERVAVAGQALQAQATKIRETGDEWADSLRESVRAKPLTALLTALAIGAVIARISHSGNGRSS